LKKIVTLLLLSLFILSCDDSEYEESLEITIPVNVKEVKRGPIRAFVNATSDIYALKQVTLLSQSDGFYRLAVNPETGRQFEAGERVKKGVTIIHLDNPEVENTIAIESKKLNLDISKREYEKQQSLYEKGGVTQRELINAERTYIDAQYAYNNAQIQLQKMKISASFDGIITSLPYYTPGIYVTIGQKMAEVMDYSKMYADVSYPAKHLGQIKRGQDVIVTQYNLPGDTLHGVVDQVNPALDMTSRSFNSHIIVDNPDGKLRPGMFVKLETIVASRDSALVIPQEVILSKRRGKTVFVVEKNAAQERVINTGLENEKSVEVLSGLKEDERLVVKGFETLRNRSKVKIVR
jgi:RND family efflux transporter MFP subunit